MKETTCQNIKCKKKFMTWLSDNFGRGRFFCSHKCKSESQWKGDKASYYTIHEWIGNVWGKADHCEHCGSTWRTRYDWANISGEYRRERNDWKQLCRPCHSLYDGKSKMTDELCDLIEEMLSDGVSINRTSNLLGISTATVFRLAKDPMIRCV